jgi:hypothetical protein
MLSDLWHTIKRVEGKKPPVPPQNKCVSEKNKEGILAEVRLFSIVNVSVFDHLLTTKR